MTDTTQELDEILDGFARAVRVVVVNGLSHDKYERRQKDFKQAIIDWHNKHELQVRIEARIEEIEHVADYTNGMTHQMFENLKFRIAELEAERDRLNPSKSTPFNELKERDDE